jgi:hypothetical protein
VTELDEHVSAGLTYLREALAHSDEAPLSVRRAMLVVMLVDALVDELGGRVGEDPLRARAAIAHLSSELALVLEIAAHRGGGPRLVVEEVEVPLVHFETLATAEFMVSLYNEHTVSRLLVAIPDGTRQDARPVLHAAVAAVERVGR